MLVAGALLGGVGDLVACGGSPAPRKPQPTALVTLQCEVADAEVWIDGRYFREVAELSRAFRLRAGAHHIEVRHQNYHSMYYELAVTAGTQRVLRVELAERLP